MSELTFVKVDEPEHIAELANFAGDIFEEYFSQILPQNKVDYLVQYLLGTETITREIADDDEYRLTADFLHSGDEIYNGSVNFSVHDGRLEYLDYELYTMLPLGEEYTLSADGVARLIRRGEFICTGGVMISSEIDEVQCRTVNIVYASDSKNFYRPMYSIEAVINGGVATILLPAF